MEAWQKALLAWYRENARPLPWRGEKDPYRVLVSEVLLQQTRVEQAALYYRRFLERFPTLKALAAASLEEVLRVWQGAGYYRRAEHLHRLARSVEELPPGFAAPEMYRRDASMGPWTDIYAIGACLYACMQGYPPNDAPQRLEKDRLSMSLSRLRGVYSDNLIEVVEWCMALDPLSRPQSVFALQKELSREGERRYTKLSVGEKVRLQFDTLVSDAKKNVLPQATGVKTK